MARPSIIASRRGADQHAAQLPRRVAQKTARLGTVSLIVVLLAAGAVLAGWFLWYYLAPPAGSPSPEPGRREMSLAASEQAPAAASQQSAVPARPPIPATQPGSAQETIAEANEVLEHLTARFPENPDAYEVMARFRYWAGETAAAVQAWETCLKLDPSYAHAYAGLGSVAAKRGDHQAAATLYHQALSIDSQSLSIRTELAKALIAAEQTDQAITLLQETTESFPREPEVFYQLAIAYQQDKEFAKAKQSFETTLALQPRYAAAQIGLANACMRLGLEEEARRHQERFEQLRADEVEQSRQARLRFDDVQATRQEVARIYVDAGRVYLAQSDPVASEQIWTRASRLDPRSIDCRQALAWLYLQQGKKLQTIDVLRELAELEPNNLSYRLEIARLSLEIGQVAQAEQTLQALRQAVPEDAAGHAALAQLYLQTGQKLPQALALAQKVVQLAPNAEHHALLSGAYERNQRWAEAAETMAEAVRMEPQNPRYRQMHALLSQQAAQFSKKAE